MQYTVISPKELNEDNILKENAKDNHLSPFFFRIHCPINEPPNSSLPTRIWLVKLNVGSSYVKLG